jgi:hypothetical protein
MEQDWPGRRTPVDGEPTGDYLGTAAALLADMLLPGKRSRALIFSGLACRLLTRYSGRPGGITRRQDIQEGSL